MNINQELYEKELAEKQRQHLQQIANNTQAWQPCMHDQCTSCYGTGIKLDGSPCIHAISCSCPKCRTSYSYQSVQSFESNH